MTDAIAALIQEVLDRSKQEQADFRAGLEKLPSSRAVELEIAALYKRIRLLKAIRSLCVAAEGPKQKRSQYIPPMVRSRGLDYNQGEPLYLLSARARKIGNRLGCKEISDFAGITRETVLGQHGAGKQVADEIASRLADLGKAFKGEDPATYQALKEQA